MKISYKGEYKGEEFPKGDLPPNAVKFKEPETLEKVRSLMNLLGFIGLVPVLFMILISYIIHGEINIGFSSLALIGMVSGMVVGTFALIPHELLHAIAFGKNAEVDLYFSLKNSMAFAYCTKAVSKAQFIFILILPTLVLGVAPLIIWAILPYHELFSNFLIWFSIINFFSAGGDYMNIYNAIRQMPKGSIHQPSGFNSYWYMPK